MIKESSSGVHFDCLFAGDAAGWGEDGGGRLTAVWNGGGGKGAGACIVAFRGGSGIGGASVAVWAVGYRSPIWLRSCSGGCEGCDTCDCSLMEGREAFVDGPTREVAPETLDDVEVRCEDPGCRLPVDGRGTDEERVCWPPPGPLVVAGGDGVREGGGLDLRSSDMSSLAVVRVRGA